MQDTVRTKRFCFGLVGTGRIGRVHFKNLVLNERASVKYIVEEDAKAAQELLYQYKMEDNITIIPAAKIGRVFEDEDVDAVMVCSPSKTHESIVKQALQSGKAVFCEKPLALTIQAVKDCYQAAEKANKPLFVGFNRRFDPQLSKLKRQVREGKLGTLKLVRSTSMDPPGIMTKEYIRTSGGIFADTVLHDIDMANWLVGAEPETVYATGHAWDPLWTECGDVETSAVVLTYPGGAVAMLDVHRNVEGGYDQRVEATGSNGTIQSCNRKEMDLDFRTNNSIQSSPIYCDFMKRYEASYAKELDHFINVMDGKEKCDVTKESTLAVNLTVEACTKSLHNKKIVELKDVAAEYL